MYEQVFRRRQQTNYPRRRENNTSEEDMHLVQAQLSDIGSIRDLQAQRATEAEAPEKTKEKKIISTDEETNGF
jgi:hypothetical protein|tara:strand:- start:6228 stop:6446 length:219 start_codon:yes stop_codon:yes gene_type:complete